MRFVDRSVPAARTNSYPDTHCTDPSCSAPLDSSTRLICGNLGTISHDNFGEQISSRPGELPAFLWMTPIDHHLENDFSPSQPFVQYADSILLHSLSASDRQWSSSLPQWDGAVSHPDSPSTLSYYADQTTDSHQNPYWAELDVMTASIFLDDSGSESIPRDCVSRPAWNDGIDGHGIEQPSYLPVDDGRHVTASTVFTDHNLDFGPSPRITAQSYDVYSSSPLAPESLPHGHDHRRHISLPTHGSHPAPAANRWKCPYCNYVQGRRRMVDLKRHIATHTKPSDVALWTCCGYPREAARSKGVPDDVIRETSAIHGRVGGCWETFSRRDALQRHLRKQKGRCFGDAYAEWHPGNNKRDRQTKARAHVEDSCQWDE